MSCIYFHSQAGTARVSGAERAQLGDLCSRALRFTLGRLESWGGEPPWILEHIPAGNYLHGCATSGRGFSQAVDTWLNVGHMTDRGNDYLALRGEKFPLFTLQLNSAMVLGGDAFRLAARLHGQCAIHCYVDGPNRAWLAGMIDRAVDQRIFREGMGWESVVTLLRSHSDAPVVCSYSVCDQFPNRHVADWKAPENDPDGDSWHDLSAAERWERGMAGLRASDGGLELKPEGWDSFYFGSAPVSGFDFANKPKDETATS